MATSTNNFLNMIKASIRRNVRYPITDVGFKLKTEDNITFPTQASTYIIGSAPTGNPTAGIIEFRYTTDNNTKYYLPAVDSNNIGQSITDIEVWCKFDIIFNQTSNPDIDSSSYGNTGIYKNMWIKIHTANNTSGVTFDENDYILSIAVDLQLETSAGALPANRLVEKFFTAGIHPTFDNRPRYFKFKGADEYYLKDENSNTDFYTGEPDENGTPGPQVLDQFAEINNIDGSSDAARCTVFLPAQKKETNPVTDQAVTTYELYALDNMDSILIDTGSLVEDGDSLGDGIPWQAGDSVNFTYTNDVLNKITG